MFTGSAPATPMSASAPSRPRSSRVSLNHHCVFGDRELVGWFRGTLEMVNKFREIVEGDG